MLRTQILIPEKLKSRLETKAKEKNISMGELIRRYTSEKLEEEKTISPLGALLSLSRIAKKALRKLEKLKEHDLNLFVDFYIIAEVVRVVSQRVGKKQANQFLELYKEDVFSELEIDERVKSDSISIFKKKRSKNFPFFDAVHISSIKAADIFEVLTFDRHFINRRLFLPEEYFGIIFIDRIKRF